MDITSCLVPQDIFENTASIFPFLWTSSAESYFSTARAILPEFVWVFSDKARTIMVDKNRLLMSFTPMPNDHDEDNEDDEDGEDGEGGSNMADATSVSTSKLVLALATFRSDLNILRAEQLVLDRREKGETTNLYRQRFHPLGSKYIGYIRDLERMIQEKTESRMAQFNVSVEDAELYVLNQPRIPSSGHTCTVLLSLL